LDKALFLTASNDDATATMLSVARGELDVGQLAGWLAGVTRKLV